MDRGNIERIRHLTKTKKNYEEKGPQQKHREWTPFCLQFMPCFTAFFKPPTVSSPVGYVGKETLRKRENIYCYLRNGHFITVNQFVTTTRVLILRYLSIMAYLLKSVQVPINKATFSCRTRCIFVTSFQKSNNV
jgi:hypothetical protein